MTVQRRRAIGIDRVRGFSSIIAIAIACGAASSAAAQIAGVPPQNPPTEAPAPTDVGSAQTQTQTQADGTTGGDVVVTGSRIVRNGFQAPTPVTVLTQQEIQNQSPSNNIADFVNELPALAGSTRPSNSRLNLSSGAAGINALNLRNLDGSATGTRTLVLIDGRRSVGSTITGVVDINTIPQQLVERVEIVTGGASAAYGSDAVAGVVNFILDKKYTGIKATVDDGVTTYGDGHNSAASIAAGIKFGHDDRGHILLSGEIAHRDGIFYVDRDWNATGYVRIQDPNWTANSTTPQFLIQRQVGAANSTPGGLITGSAGGTANRLRGLYFGQGGQVLQYQYGALTFPSPTGSAAPTLTQGGSWQVNDSGRRIGLDPSDDRRGVFGRLSYEVGDGINLFAEGSYNWQQTFFNAGPNLQTGIAYKPDNAYLINTLGSARLAGITSVTVATTAADLPFRVINNRRSVQRYIVGAEGDTQLFGRNASYNVYGQYGQADLHEQLNNIMNIANMANATDAVFAPANNALGVPAGTIVCRSSLTAPTNGCVPLDRLGIGVANPAAISYVLGNPYRDEKLEELDFGANASVTPFRTWAGDVSVAFGGEYRNEKVSGFVPVQYQPIISTGANGRPTTTNVWSVGNYLPTNGSYNVKEAFIETVVPLGLGIEFNGAARATRYSTAGYVTTWKLGATWQPIPDIRFRVTRSRDIRAPNLNELYQAGSANSDSVRNPAYTTDGTNGPATYSYSAVATGNPNLKPEDAANLEAGVVVTPRFLHGFSASADFFRINIKNAISSFGAQDIINLCYQGQTQFCSAYTIDPTRSIPGQPYLLFRTQPFNAASQLVKGIDLDVSYTLPVHDVFANAPGTFTFRGLATNYIQNLFNSGIPGTPVLNSAGVNGSQGSTPSWIYRFSATYDTPGFSITGVGRGVSAGKYVANAIVCSTDCPTGRTATQISQFPTYASNHASGLFYADLNLTAKLHAGGKRAEVFLNVTNLFNRWPLLVPETGLAANATYSDLLGRQFRVGVRFQTR